MTAALRRIHPLAPILIIAFALRVASACAPIFAHPDEIYQYLEPAHRLLKGDGVVTWEFRLGMRSWLLPGILAIPMAIGHAISPDGDLFLILPRMMAAIASLAIVGSAWTMGMRQSRLHAVVAAIVTATWFELIYFAGRTLSEPLATAAIFPAAVLLTRPAPGGRALLSAGFLLGMASLLRPHYAPACAVIVLVACGRHRLGRLMPIIAGGLIAAAVGGAIDIASGSMPFGWIIENFHQNIVEHRAERYGTAPAFAYVAWLEAMWSWWMIPLLVALRFGYRSSPPLFWAAIATLLVHGLIGHKEYRFIFLAVAIFVTLAALGTAELVCIAKQRRTAIAPPILSVAALLAWMAASLWLNDRPAMRFAWEQGRAGSVIAKALRDDPGVCGVALYDPVTFADIPGFAGMPRGRPLSMFRVGDPAFGAATAPQALARWRAGYNRIVTTSTASADLPDDFVRGACVPLGQDQMCLFSREGGCDDARASPFEINAAIRRLHF